jgi:hypothetical protein
MLRPAQRSLRGQQHVQLEVLGVGQLTTQIRSDSWLDAPTIGGLVHGGHPTECTHW